MLITKKKRTFAHIFTTMQYSRVIFRVESAESFVQDVLTQQLADIGFDSFVNEADGSLTAYIPTSQYSRQALNNLLSEFPFGGVSLCNTELCEDKDWNAEWERNSFQPIQIGSECLIHAPFHKDLPQCRYDIIIDPKMAFGTGTHQTTSLILSELLKLDLQGKSLLDMGCGTVVLALLARKLGASPVTAVDIDTWCTENAADNCRLNNINDIEILLGDARLLEGRHFDVILANINRNILMMDMPRYATCLNKGGMLIISGFYEEDISILQAKASECGLALSQSNTRDNWAMMVLNK